MNNRENMHTSKAELTEQILFQYMHTHVHVCVQQHSKKRDTMHLKESGEGHMGVWREEMRKCCNFLMVSKQEKMSYIMFYFFLLSIVCRHISYDEIQVCVLLLFIFLMGERECSKQREEKERDKKIETDTHTHTQRSCLWIVCMCVFPSVDILL